MYGRTRSPVLNKYFPFVASSQQKAGKYNRLKGKEVDCGDAKKSEEWHLT